MQPFSIPHIDHINVERTQRELGVNVFTLRPVSAKLVYRICALCGVEEIRPFRAVSYSGQIRCLTCSNAVNAKQGAAKRSQAMIKWHASNEHPRLGAKVTPENRTKMTEGARNRVIPEEERERKRQQMTGEGNPFYGKTHSPESLRLMSAASQRNARKGPDSNLYGRCYYAKAVSHIDRKGRVHRLKSGWEVKVAVYLDEQGVEWDYERQAYPVTYVYEGRERRGTYTPDFFVGDEVWEVKGYWRKDARVKWDAFLLAYPELKVRLLDKAGLTALGVRVS